MTTLRDQVAALQARYARDEQQPKRTPLDKQTGGDHYKKLKIQPAYYNWANRIPFIEGCCIKYLTRWRDKGGLEDIQKSKHLHELLIYFETTPLVLIEQSKIDELEQAMVQAGKDFAE